MKNVCTKFRPPSQPGTISTVLSRDKHAGNAKATYNLTKTQNIYIKVGALNEYLTCYKQKDKPNIPLHYFLMVALKKKRKKGYN